MASFSFEGVFDLDEALSMPTMVVDSSPSSPRGDWVSVTTSFPAVNTSNDAVCSVCTEDFRPPHSGGRQIPCGHVYHVQCIATWLSVRDTCPLCREVVVDQKRALFKSNC